ncbi:MAG: CZB domain-containing protein [Candidatus Eisenbacteria bacterium]
MDFDAAIRAHSEWKQKLSRYLKNPDRSLDCNQIQKDDQCALGQWLHGEGRAFAKHPEYLELLRKHADFHRAASAIVRRIDTGEKVGEDVLFGSRSDYGRLSGEVVMLIMNMRKKAA